MRECSSHSMCHVPWVTCHLSPVNCQLSHVKIICLFFTLFVEMFKLHNKMHKLNKIPYKYLVNALLNLKNYICASFSWTFKQNVRENLTKKKFWQNTLCLEQQIYSSQDNFTQLLVVMVETFRRYRGYVLVQYNPVPIDICIFLIWLLIRTSSRN